MASACVLAIVAAWTIMFLRVVVMVRLVHASLAAVLGLPLGLMAAGGVLVAGALSSLTKKVFDIPKSLAHRVADLL